MLAGCLEFPGCCLAASPLGPQPVWKRRLELPSLNLANRPSDPHRGPGSLARHSDCDLVLEKQAATY